MSKNFIRAISLILMVGLIGLPACGGETPQQKQQQSKLEKMKPMEEDRLRKLMDRAWDNYVYLLYGFMNYDNEKIKVATANIVEMSPYMARRITPQYQKQKTQWNEQCNQQRDFAANIKRHFEEQNFGEARKSLNELLEVCMECHKVYRSHLFKTEY